jgi:hypothetical protein
MLTLLPALLVVLGCLALGSVAIPMYSRQSFDRLEADMDDVDTGALSIPLKKLKRTDEQRKSHFSALREHHSFLLEIMGTEKNRGSVEKDPSEIPVAFNTYSLWIGTIGVGTPMQEFNVVYDTGSSQLWVNSDSCTDDGCTENSRFHPSLSSSYKDQGIDMDVKFGTGSITGRIAQDTVTLGGVSVKKNYVGMIDDESGSVFVEYDIDGILGLSFASLSNLAKNGIDYKTVMDQILEQKLSEPKISFYYNGDQSDITIGKPKSRHYKGSVQYIDVSKEEYWELELADIKMGGESLGLCNPTCRAVIDTGTSFLTAPSGSVSTVLHKINDHRSNDWNCDMSELNQLPSLTYVFKDSKGTYEFSLKGPEYMTRDQDECAPAFMQLDVPSTSGDLWILGDIFFEKYFTVFSREAQPQVGFAHRA